MTTLINLEQGSPEWLEYRSDPERCNASESGAVVGENPWTPKTPLELYRLKMGEITIPTTAAMRRGNDFEPAARAKCEEINDIILAPAVFERWPYSASLDAVTADLKTCKVEIKIPAAGRDSATWRSIESGEIPRQYWWQMVHQHYVVPTQRVLFFVYCPDTDEYHQEEIDTAALEADWVELEKAWEQFRVSIGTQTPPEPTDRDKVNRADDEWARAAADLIDCERSAQEALSRLEDARTVIKDLSHGTPATGAGVTISWYRQRGRVQYNKIPALVDVDLEEYRAGDSLRSRITIDQQEKRT